MVGFKALFKNIASVLGSVKLNAAIRVSAIGISLFLQVYIVRVLGEVAYGEYSIFVALVSFLVIFGKAGGDVICMREIAMDIKIRKGESFWSIIINVLAFSFISSVLVSIVYVVYFWTGEGLGWWKVVLGLYVISNFLIIISILRGMFKDLYAEVLENMARPFLFFLLICCGLIIEFLKEIDVSLLFILATFGVVALGWGLVILERGFKFERVKLNLSLVRGVPGIVGAGLSSYCLFQLDKLFLAKYVSASDVGGYNMVCNFVRIVPFFSFLIVSKMQPLLAENWGKGNKNLFYSDAKKVFLSSIFFGLIGVFLLVVIGEWILNFTSSSYRELYIVLLVVAVGHLFNCAAIAINSVLHMAKLDNKSAMNQAASALIGGVLFYFLIPMYGVMGGAISATIAMFFGFVFSLRDFYSIKEEC